MFVGYEQRTVVDAVQTIADLTIPVGTHQVQIQASVVDIRYTMDNVTNPTQTLGMVFEAGAEQPTEFLGEDLIRIRFIRGAGQGNGLLNFHYSSGRQI